MKMLSVAKKRPNKINEHSPLLVRSAILSALLLHALILAPDALSFYNSDWVPRGDTFSGTLPIFTILCKISNPQSVLFFSTAEIATLFVALRFYRSQKILFFVLFFCRNNYEAAYAAQDGGTNLLQIFLIYLLFLPPSAARTCDTQANTSRHSHNACIKLMQFQLLLVYIVAATSKINGPLWRNGMALYYIFQNDYYTSSLSRALALRFSSWTIFLTYSALCIQIIFCFLVFSERWRLAAIVCGCLLHLGIAVGMGMYSFALIMIFLYSIFITTEDIAYLSYVAQQFFTNLRCSFLGTRITVQLNRFQRRKTDKAGSLIDV